MNLRKIIIMSAACLLVATGIAGAQGVTPQTLLPGALIPQFMDPLPVAEQISVVDATVTNMVDGTTVPPTPFHGYNIYMKEFKAQILPSTGVPANPAAGFAGLGTHTGSWVWGYLTDADIPAPTVYPFRKSYLGPVVLAKRDVETRPTYTNALPYGGGSEVQPLLPIDQTLDWADPYSYGCVGADIGGRPECFASYQGPQPDGVHIHGGEVAPLYDGGPEAWWLPVNDDPNVITVKGLGSNADPATGEAVFIYPTKQQAGTIWFHPHGFGVTRLNVYAGMAGMYIITDPANEPPKATAKVGDVPGTCSAAAPFNGCLPNAAYDIPLIIQDRSFDTTGQIFYNLASNPQPNIGVHPFWIPEFIGDVIVVNGKTWPYLEVEPRKYRFRLLNGSNARFYDLSMNKGLKFTVIATDDGYLNAPVLSPNVIIAPGERYEVIVDFSGLKQNTNVTLFNAARTPFPGGGRVVAGTTDTVMQFRVNKPLSAIADATTLPTNLRPKPFVDIKTQAVANRPVPGACPVVTIDQSYPSTNTIVRQLTLNEVIGPGGPLELVLNNTKYNGSPSTFAELGRRESERPAVGDTEIWEIINITADAHPIHTHLASFQLLNRQGFQAAPWTNVYASQLAGTYGPLPDGLGPPNLYLTQNADCAIGGNPAIGPYLQANRLTLPLPYENGWKDTVIAYPGEVTRIVVRWAETDRAVGSVQAGDSTAYPFSTAETIEGIGYVWHCHILDHEDNEMMRPYIVGAKRQVIN